MKFALDWFRTLHPIVQGTVVVCSCTFLIAVVFNKEASTNVVNILPYLLYLMGSNITIRKNKSEE